MWLQPEGDDGTAELTTRPINASPINQTATTSTETSPADLPHHGSENIDKQQESDSSQQVESEISDFEPRDLTAPIQYQSSAEPAEKGNPGETWSIKDQSLPVDSSAGPDLGSFYQERIEQAESRITGKEFEGISIPKPAEPEIPPYVPALEVPAEEEGNNLATVTEADPSTLQSQETLQASSQSETEEIPTVQERDTISSDDQNPNSGLAVVWNWAIAAVVISLLLAIAFALVRRKKSRLQNHMARKRLSRIEPVVIESSDKILPPSRSLSGMEDHDFQTVERHLSDQASIVGHGLGQPDSLESPAVVERSDTAEVKAVESAFGNLADSNQNMTQPKPTQQLSLDSEAAEDLPIVRKDDGSSFNTGQQRSSSTRSRRSVPREFGKLASQPVGASYQSVQSAPGSRSAEPVVASQQTEDLPGDSETEILKRQLSEAKQSVEKLSEQLYEKESQSTELERAKEKISLLEKASAKLQASMKTRAESSASQTRISELESILEAESSRFEHLNSRLSEADEKLAEAERTKLAIRSQLDQRDASLEEREQAFQKLQAQQQETQAELTRTLRQIEEDKQIAAAFREASKRAKEKDSVELGNIQQTLRETAEELTSAREQVAQQESSTKISFQELEQLRNDHAELVEKNAALAQQFQKEQEERTKLVQAKTTLESSLAALDNRFAESDSKLSGLQSELASTKSEKEILQQQQVAELDAANQKIAAAEAERDALAKIAMEFKAIRNKQQSQRKQLDSELEQVKQQFKSSRKTLKNSEDRVKRLEAEIAQAAKQIVAGEQAAAKLSKLEAESSELLKQKLHLQNNLEELQRKFSEESGEKVRLASELTTNRKLTEQLTRACDRVTNALEQERFAREALDAKVLELQNIAATNVQAEGDATQVEELQTRLEDAFDALDELQEEFKPLAGELEKHQAQLSEVIAKRQQIAEELYDEQTENMRLQQEVKRVQGQFDAAQKTENRLTAELEKSRTEQDVLADRIAQLESLNQATGTKRGGKIAGPLLALSPAGAKSAADRDDLIRIKGIGKVMQEKLYTHGIYTFEQIINLDDQDIAEMSDIASAARIKREKWSEQATSLNSN